MKVFCCLQGGFFLRSWTGCFLDSFGGYRLFTRVAACVFLAIVFWIAGLLLGPGGSRFLYGEPDWLGDWEKRIKLTVKHDLVAGDLVDFPLLIYLGDVSGRNNADLTYIFDRLGANSRKIAVTVSDGITQCNVEIERWEAANEKAWLWVRVPFVDSSADTVLYFYYDNDQPDNPFVNVTGTAVAQNVWSNGYLGVWHMQDQNPSLVADSSGNGINGTKRGADEPQEFGGIIGRGQFFDGINDFIRLGNDSLNQELDGAGGITVSAWVNPSSLADGGPDDRNVIIDIPVEDELAAVKIYLAGDGRLIVGGLSTKDDGFRSIQSVGPVVETASWQHLAVVLDFPGDLITGYVDGQPIISGVSNFGSAVFVPGDGNDEMLGVNTDQTGSKFFHGGMDTVLLSGVARSDVWVDAEYLSAIDDLITYPYLHLTGNASVQVEPILYFSRRHAMSVMVNIENLTEEPHRFSGGVDVINNVDPDEPELAGNKGFATDVINGGAKTRFGLMIGLDEPLLVKHRFNGYASIDD